MMSNDFAKSGVFGTTTTSAGSLRGPTNVGSVRSASNVQDVPSSYDVGDIRQIMHPFSSLHRPSFVGGSHTSQDLPPASLLSRFIENQTSKMKVIDCKAVLTLGFGIKPTGKLSELRQCVSEQLAKGRSDHAFWRSMLSPPPVAIGSCGSLNAECDGEPRGQKRYREGGALLSLVPPSAPDYSMPSYGVGRSPAQAPGDVGDRSRTAIEERMAVSEAPSPQLPVDRGDGGPF